MKHVWIEHEKQNKFLDIYFILAFLFTVVH